MPQPFDRDAEVLWHPASHFADQTMLPPSPVVRAAGAYLYDADGRPILDAISSWWTALHGHCHPRIVRAVQDQVGVLDHVMFAGFTHAPAIELAERLLAVAGPGYGKVFYADCGSAAVEVAMKMAFQYHLQRGDPDRRRFAALRRGYHGETLGALAACGEPTFRAPFDPLLQPAVLLPVPSHPRHTTADLATDLGAASPEADAAVDLLREHAGSLAALVVEPAVQCAGRMNMPGSGYMRRVVETAQSLGILVISDEIAVGLGRTARLLAGQWAKIEPDFVCVSKALAGGILPLAAVVIRAGIETAFEGPPSRSFLHSHTFTGNPITCRAAAESLAMLTEPDTGPRLTRLADALAGAADRVAGACRTVETVRSAGLIVAFDLAPWVRERVPGGRVSRAIRKAALARGLLLRPLHDTVYWMPPACLSDDDVAKLADRTAEAIEAATSAS